MNPFQVLGLIPARGGSQGVPRKNIRSLAGKPVIAHTLAAARSTKTLDRVIVSTDSAEIAEIARSLSAEVPFLRPAEFAQNDTPDWPVFHHALQWLEREQNYKPDIIVHLRPTNPCRTSDQIDRGVRLMQDHPEADSVRSVSSPAQNPYKMWREQGAYLAPILSSDLPEAYNQPRQKLPQIWWQNGYIDIAWRKTIMEKHSMTGDKIVPLILEDAPWVDIDGPESFELAEIYMERKLVKSASAGNR